MSDFSTGVKKWAIFGNIFHWGDEWGGSHWVTEAGVFFFFDNIKTIIFNYSLKVKVSKNLFWVGRVNSFSGTVDRNLSQTGGCFLP